MIAELRRLKRQEHIELMARFLGVRGIEVRPKSDSLWVKAGYKEGTYQIWPWACYVLEGYQGLEARRIFLSREPWTDDVHYAICLHELGHAATTVYKEGHHRATLYYESLAWQWARTHALWWNSDMQEAMRVGIESYAFSIQVLFFDEPCPQFPLSDRRIDGTPDSDTNSSPDDVWAGTRKVRRPGPDLWPYRDPQRELTKLAVAADKLRGKRIAHPNS